MTDKRFTDREVDKLPAKKGKQYMWNYIRQKTGHKKEGWSFVGFLKSLIMVPARLASMSAVAAVLIVAIVMTTNFGPLQTETVHAAFAMVANEEDSSGVKGDTSFTLLASTDVSEEEVRESLRVQPEVAVHIEKTGDGEYKVSPAAELEANGVYNFSISNDEGEFSWTYQVQDNFKVTGSIPSDMTTYVPVGSGIEIIFSHENYDIEKFEKHFSITPAVKGTFEKHRRTAVFVPTKPLEAGTLYAVKVAGAMSLEGSEQALGEDFTFQFETSSEDSSYQKLRFAQDYYESGVGAAVAMNVYMPGEERDSDKPVFVNVYRFADANAYLEAIGKVLEVPNWCYFAAQDFRHDSNGLVHVGEFETQKDQYNWYDYLYLPGAELKEGYYLIEIQDEGKDGDQALLQVTDLSNYVNVSLTDTLFWVNDVATGQPVAGAELKIEGLKKTYETNAEGVATFETPEEWKNNDFVNFETYIVTVTSPDEKRLVTILMPTGSENVGNQYWRYFATDRPLYQPTDSVQYWGFLKPKQGNLNDGGMTLKFMYNWNMLVKELPLDFDSDGTFRGSAELENFAPGYYDLVVMDGEKEVNRVSFEVADYVKPSYNMTIKSDKNAYFAGENMKFTIRTEFFDGTAAPEIGLDSYGSAAKNLKTGENGEVEVDIAAEKVECGGDYFCSDIHGFYFDATARFAEDSNIWAGHNAQIFDSHLYLAAQGEEKDGKGLVHVQANWVDLMGMNAADSDTDADFLGDEARDVGIEGSLREIHWEKVEDGQTYDFINKKTIPKYRYEKRTKILPNFTMETDGKGEAVYRFDVLEDKYYEIDLKGIDPKGEPAHARAMVYGSKGRSVEYDFYNVKLLNGDLVEDNNFWFYGGTGREFDIDDEVKTAMANGETVVDGEGKFLFMQQANGIREYAVEDSAYYSFDFDKEDVPNVFVDAVWFDGDSYVDAYESSAQYKKELKALEIELKADKEKYAPGEEAAVSVFVKDKSGAPVQALVNLSLIDEAFYKVAYDNNVSPLDMLYASNSTGVLQHYETHDSPLSMAAGMGEKGGCFTGETLILMADGSYKPIKDIRKGDVILTKENERSSEMVTAKVRATVAHFVPEYLVINENLEVTGVHIVYVNGGWDMAENLEIGDEMLGSDGERIEISSIRKVVEPVWVYNFEVLGQHTYFANDFYVHNDKGGDGGVYVRSDFKDTAIFDVIQTNAQGRGEFEFKLPDNITSWRMMARALDTEDLQAGMEVSSLPVSQPFFADIIMNKSYSEKDLPQIGVRAFGDELQSGDKVYFGASSQSLSLEEAVAGEAFETSFLDLGKLVAGAHEITVLAESGDLKDALKEPLKVVGSRLEKNVVDLMKNVTAASEFTLGEDGQTEIRFMDGGIAFYYSDLWQMYFSGGDRLDQRLAVVVAADLVNKYFGVEWSYNADDLVSTYQKIGSGGLSLLPYSDADLRLSAMALTADSNPSRFSSLGLRDYFYKIYMNKDSNLEEVVLSLLGLANMDEPVLVSLRTLQEDETLTLEQKLYIALAFDALGSKTEAKKIYDAVFDELAGDEDSARATALGAILAASFGETEAADLLWDFVELTGVEDELVLLEKLAYLRHSLASANPNPLVFSVNGEDVELEMWEEYGAVIFPGDKVKVEVEQGDLAAVVHYTEKVEPEDFDGDERLSIKRSYKVDGVETDTLKDGDLVLVNLEVDFAGEIEHPYFQVTDILPSGLKFVTSPVSAGYDIYYGASFRYPYRTNGQEVSFYWGKPKEGEIVKTIQYYARVVNPGKFYADPAKIENYYDPSLANISDSDIVKIQAVN